MLHPLRLLRRIAVLLILAAAVFAVWRPSLGHAVTARRPVPCRSAKSAYGTLTVCPGRARVGAVVRISANTLCGAVRGSTPPHALGLTLVFLGPRSYLGAGGGGVQIPYTVTKHGFRARFRIPATYPGPQGAGRPLRVRKGRRYAFATYPAAACRVPFTVTAG